MHFGKKKTIQAWYQKPLVLRCTACRQSANGHFGNQHCCWKKTFSKPTEKKNTGSVDFTSSSNNKTISSPMPDPAGLPPVSALPALPQLSVFPTARPAGWFCCSGRPALLGLPATHGFGFAKQSEKKPHYHQAQSQSFAWQNQSSVFTHSLLELTSVLVIIWGEKWIFRWLQCANFKRVFNTKAGRLERFVVSAKKSANFLATLPFCWHNYLLFGFWPKNPHAKLRIWPGAPFVIWFFCTCGEVGKK